MRLSKLVEWDSPVIINLSELFAARDLHYRVAAECASVVEVELLNNRGMMVLKASSVTQSGDRTRLAVRASDNSGCSALIVFDVIVRYNWDADLAIAG